MKPQDDFSRAEHGRHDARADAGLHIPAAAGESDAAYSEDGVDLTLIRWMLSLSPAERLAVLRDFINFVSEARARNHEI